MSPFLTHIALHVADVAACVEFYQEYCGLKVVHERGKARAGNRTVWLAEPGKENTFVVVFISGGPSQPQASHDFSHLGFALGSREAVDALAERARLQGRLIWPPRQEAYPVGYFCGVKGPDGRVVEFSYGQPLGPGVEAP